MLENPTFRPHEQDWTASFRSAFRDWRSLGSYLGSSENFSDQAYPVFVPQDLAARIKAAGPGSALWKQFVPSQSENISGGFYDPIGDGAHAKGGGIIHRYKNRLLFSPTTVCPVNCRYCFRKNELGEKDDILKGKLTSLVSYLDDHPQLEEVILTGGDPLMLSDAKIKTIIEILAKRVPYLRFHTRTPVIMPERINKSFLNLLDKAADSFEVVSLAVHANSVEEFYPQNAQAIKDIARVGIQTLSQSVLLKGVNDSVENLTALYKTFASLGVKAYYLHHPDQVQGAMGFTLSLEEGRKLYSSLRDELPGWAIPHYVIDPENGQGKNLAYNPESIEFSGRLLDRFNRFHNLSR